MHFICWLVGEVNSIEKPIYYGLDHNVYVYLCYSVVLENKVLKCDKSQVGTFRSMWLKLNQICLQKCSFCKCLVFGLFSGLGEVTVVSLRISRILKPGMVADSCIPRT